MRQGSLRFAAENTAVFCLDPQILARGGYLRLETASRSYLAGKEVCVMRTYEVRMFVPTICAIEVEDDADVLEVIGELYKELYRKNFRDWIESLPELEDSA
jgi:hypothetical protein